MFGDLIPLPIDSNCPQFTSPKVGQEQGATTRDASGFTRAQHYHTARQKWHAQADWCMDRCISWHSVDTRAPSRHARVLTSKMLHILLDSVDFLLSISMISADLLVFDSDTRRQRHTALTASILFFHQTQHDNNWLYSLMGDNIRLFHIGGGAKQVCNFRQEYKMLGSFSSKDPYMSL